MKDVQRGRGKLSRAVAVATIAVSIARELQGAVVALSVRVSAHTPSGDKASSLKDSMSATPPATQSSDDPARLAFMLVNLDEAILEAISLKGLTEKKLKVLALRDDLLEGLAGLSGPPVSLAVHYAMRVRGWLAEELACSEGPDLGADLDALASAAAMAAVALPDLAIVERMPALVQTGPRRAGPQQFDAAGWSTLLHRLDRTDVAVANPRVRVRAYAPEPLTGNESVVYNALRGRRLNSARIVQFLRPRIMSQEEVRNCVVQIRRKFGKKAIITRRHLGRLVYERPDFPPQEA